MPADQPLLARRACVLVDRAPGPRSSRRQRSRGCFLARQLLLVANLVRATDSVDMAKRRESDRPHFDCPACRSMQAIQTLERYGERFFFCPDCQASWLEAAE